MVINLPVGVRNLIAKRKKYLFRSLCTKNSTSFDLSDFFIQTAGLEYHWRTKCGAYHQGRRSALASHHASACIFPAAWWYAMLRIDDIPQRVADDIHAVRRDWDARLRKALEFPWKIWYNTLKEVIWNEESIYFTTYSLHLFTGWQYDKSVEFIDRDSICTLCLYRSTSLDIGDLIRYCHCQTDKERKKQKEIILIGIIGHLLFVFTSFRHLFTRLRQRQVAAPKHRT